MASVTAGGKAGKPSFAKIAAANVKPPSSTQQTPSTAEKSMRREITSSPRSGPSSHSLQSDSAAPAITPSPDKAEPSNQQNLQMAVSVDKSPAQVRIQSPGEIPSPLAPSQATDGMLMPASSDASTQLSSSASDSVKPPSLDGKSVASGTTFALDEKESLRPDDSASVKATDDEDIFSPPSTGLPDSRAGSDDGVRAFRDQLREISGMEPSRRPGPPPNLGQSPAPQGVLYVPPQGSGVGTVPGVTRPTPAVNTSVEVPPDPKLLEALESPKDRIMVLKLEQDIVDFVKDPKETSLKLPQTNAFYRMLAHRLADYYMLGHVVDESTQAVRIFKTQNGRIPPPLTDLATPSTAASTPPPLGAQMKILRRGDNTGAVGGSNLTSKTTSENGESGEDDKRPKAPVSREEREARYEAARKRIMGSAKPSDSPEEVSQKEISRPGSTTGRKATKKKQRADSDDDFEARSAYSAYYPPQFSPNAPTSQSYGVPGFTHSGNQMSPANFSTQDASTGLPQFGTHGQGSWQNQSYAAQGTQSGWSQNQQQGYDLSSNFQQAMSFQPQMQPQPPNGQTNFNMPYNGQYYNQQQAWPQQNFQMPPQTPTSGYAYMSNFQNRPSSSSGPMQENMPYAFGQLPSQTFPGRPASKSEHPLPGSYKSKHFNPQSQSFTPGQPGNVMNMGTGVGVSTTSGPQMNSPGPSGGFAGGTPTAIVTTQHQQQPQMSPFQHSPHVYGSPSSSHQQQQPLTPSRLAPQPNNASTSPSSQPLTHPLPQPVFPRQPSPNLPLPPRPDASSPSAAPPAPALAAVASSYQVSAPSAPAPTPPQMQPSFSQQQQHHQSHQNHSSLQPQSSIAKWGTPASLPAKPPPSAEPFDPAKFAAASHVVGSGSGSGNGPPGSIMRGGAGVGVDGFTSSFAQSTMNIAKTSASSSPSPFAGAGAAVGGSGGNGGGQAGRRS